MDPFDYQSTQKEDSTLLAQIADLLTTPGFRDFDKTLTIRTDDFKSFTNSLYIDATKESNSELTKIYDDLYKKYKTGEPLEISETINKYDSNDVKILYSMEEETGGVLTGNAEAKMRLTAARIDAIINKGKNQASLGTNTPALPDRKFSASNLDSLVEIIRREENKTGAVPQDFSAATLDKILATVTEAKDKAAAEKRMKV